ncbi:MAG: glycosyltransferase family 9 protein [Deltaproteobacteria bacterium]|nr:glycosyltransferase family 9 protein [Deltaproteobacteria bacterium]
MKIIILQLARLGDIVQTLPTIQGLKKAHPGCEITMVVRSTFADAARISPHVDKLVEFSTQDILGPTLTDPNGKAESLARLIHWVANELLTVEYDLLLNLTFTPASAYLASLVRAKDRRGVMASLSQSGDSIAIHDPWSQYFFAQVLERNLNILHVNDIFMRIAGVGAGAWPLQMNEPVLASPPPALAPDRLRIGIQLTASTNDKTLNHKVWAQICKVILSVHENSELIFFGSANDADAIVAVLTEIHQTAPGLMSHRFTVLAGRVKFHENIPWVRSCNFVVSPDTAMVHLASACGTRVIEIPLGGVRPEETGPYGDGHHIVYAANADGEQLSFEVARIIGGEKAKTVVAEAITKFTPCTTGVPRSEIVPHNFIQEATSNFFMQAYYLLAEFRCGGRQEDIVIPKLDDPKQTAALDRLVNAYDALCTTRRLSEFGQHHCLMMLENPGDQALLKDQMAKLAEIESMLAKLQNSVSLVKPLIDTWRVAKDVAYAPTSNGLEDILALTEGCYRELGQNVDIVQQLLQTAVEAAQGKVKDVKPSNSASRGAELESI